MRKHNILRLAFILTLLMPLIYSSASMGQEKYAFRDSINLGFNR